MAMGKRQRTAKQASMWVPSQDLPRSAAHPFYMRLNQILDEHDFDGYVEDLCQQFYARDGRPGLSPGRYFRLLLIGYAEAELLRDRNAGQREAIEADLSEAEKAMRRLTAAIAKGGELEPLMEALKTQERERAELRDRLKALDAAPRLPALDPATVRQQLLDYLKDWQGLFLGHVGQAQQSCEGSSSGG